MFTSSSYKISSIPPSLPPTHIHPPTHTHIPCSCHWDLQADPELQSRVETRYAEIWKWHSAMARASKLGGCPPTLSNCERYSAANLGEGPISDGDMQMFSNPSMAPPCTIVADAGAFRNKPTMKGLIDGVDVA